jgi:hypothetical protein
MKNEYSVAVRVTLWSTNERTILKFKNECEREGLSLIDEFQGKNDTLFKLRIPLGKRIFLPCKGEVDIWPHRFVGQ